MGGCLRLLRFVDCCVIFFACLIVLSSTASIMGDECDWTGSGLSSPSSPKGGVTPAYLRCSAGRVTWLYPDGALRVLLRLPNADREFRACIRILRTPKQQIRLFQEGPRSLIPLFASKESTPTTNSKAIRCFTSKNYQAAIYVEAPNVNQIEKQVAEFEYDLRPLSKGVRWFDHNEECRPCSSEELAQAFCTSDLVVRGQIQSVDSLEDTDLSQLSVRVTRMIRYNSATNFDDFQVDAIFVSGANSGGTTLSDNNSIIDDSDNNYDTVPNMVHVHVAQHCGVQHGLGEFVFMARRRLGHMALQCAPRLEDWALIMNRIVDEGRAPCVLRT